MSCNNCKLGEFKLNGEVQTGYPFPITPTVIPLFYGGEGLNGSPTWKTQDGIFGLMSWGAVAWDGECVEEDGGDCKQVKPCAGTLMFKFAFMVRTGHGTDITITAPNGDQATLENVQPIRGSDSHDGYRIDFSFPISADCGTVGEVKLDSNWVVTINGVNATHHTASGDITFELECKRCED